MVVIVKSTAFWEVMSCCPVIIYRVTCCYIPENGNIQRIFMFKKEIALEVRKFHEIEFFLRMSQLLS
jgi:hypothetical protein